MHLVNLDALKDGVQVLLSFGLGLRHDIVTRNSVLFPRQRRIITYGPTKYFVG